MAFATRLAARHDGVVKPVNGALVLAAKGQAKTASGQSLPEFHVRPEKLAAWRYARRARTDAGTSEEGVGAVEAETWSVDEAAPQLSRSGDGGAPQRQTYRLADLLAAQGSSASDANNRKRARAEFSMELEGTTSLMAEQKLVLDGFRPGIPTEWRAVMVEHDFTSSGYTCSCKAELFDLDQNDAT